MNLGGEFLDVDWLPVVSGKVTPRDQITTFPQALQYALAGHAAVRALAQRYPQGNWETAARAYYQAAKAYETLVQNPTPLNLNTMIQLLVVADAAAKLEVDRVGVKPSTPAPAPAPSPIPAPAPAPVAAKVPWWLIFIGAGAAGKVIFGKKKSA